LRQTMLGPLLRSSHLGWIERIAAIIELTIPATITLVAAYVLLLVSAILRLPDLAASREYLLFYFIFFSLTLASLALGLHAISPFLLGLLPWRFANSLFYLPYFALWKTLVSLQGHPQGWLRTARERTRRDDSLCHRPDSEHAVHIEHDPCDAQTLELSHCASERSE